MDYVVNFATTGTFTIWVRGSGDSDVGGANDSISLGLDGVLAYRINGVFPQKAMIDVGMPVESLSQSALLVEMNKVPTDLREACLDWYETRGMRFRLGANGA